MHEAGQSGFFDDDGVNVAVDSTAGRQLHNNSPETYPCAVPVS
jgi:hypothetical protein